MDDSQRKALHEAIVDGRVGTLTIKVRGISMEPALLNGDEIVCSRGIYLPGDVLAFLQGERIIIHRMIGWWFSSGSLKIVAKGDNLSRPDPPVAGSNIIGKMVHYRREGVRAKEGFFLRTARMLRSMKHYVATRI